MKTSLVKSWLPAARTLMGLLAATLTLPTALAGRPAEPVQVSLVSVSDWHGQLTSLSVGGVQTGGAAALSTYFQNERLANPNTLTLSAGDAFGASPPLSYRFDEMPAVKAMNLMGFTLDTFGNHNFDKGVVALQDLISAASFPYVCANLANLGENLAGVSSFRVVNAGGVKLGIIGILNPDTPSLVPAGSLGTLLPLDPVSSANQAQAAARRAGAKVLVAMVHLGITGFADGMPYGPLIDFANHVGGFAVIIGGDTDVNYAGIHNNAWVVQNRSKGMSYSRTTLTVDPRNGRVLARGSEFIQPVTGAVTPDPEVEALVADYQAQLGPTLDAVLGVASALFPRNGANERVREVALGNLVTDSMRLRYGTQLALMNGGGLRAQLPSDHLPADLTLRRPAAGYQPGPPYDLVVGDGYAVLPFGNAAVTRTITGAQLLAALEHSVAMVPSTFPGFLQISGFKFTYQASAPPGARVRSVTLDSGEAIEPEVLYTVVLPDFLNSGGDGYTMFVDGQPFASRDILAEVLIEYIQALGTVTPVLQGRIVRMP